MRIKPVGFEGAYGKGSLKVNEALLDIALSQRDHWLLLAKTFDALFDKVFRAFRSKAAEGFELLPLDRVRNEEVCRSSILPRSKKRTINGRVTELVGSSRCERKRCQSSLSFHPGP